MYSLCMQFLSRRDLLVLITCQRMFGAPLCTEVVPKVSSAKGI